MVLEVGAIELKLDDCDKRLSELCERVNIKKLKIRIKEIEILQSEPGHWDEAQHARTLAAEKSHLEGVVNPLVALHSKISEVYDLFLLAKEENEVQVLTSVAEDVEHLEKNIFTLEFEQMFGGEMDSNDAYLDIQSGSGGTESQDWAEMLLRMYLRWAERRGFESRLIEVSAGEIAGIKSATILVKGRYAFGWLRTETGIHRLVRKSPFNANNKRHTSFSSVFVSPDVDETINVDISPADLRIDTYRASGAGGQHVNKTESAVRITHLPSRIVVQCQDGRSQHANKEQAFKQLRAKLYEFEMQKKRETKESLEKSKSDIGWGHQIRSYVLDQSRIKDLRTLHESSNTSAVLDGDLDPFIKASLKAGY